MHLPLKMFTLALFLVSFSLFFLCPSLNLWTGPLLTQCLTDWPQTSTRINLLTTNLLKTTLPNTLLLLHVCARHTQRTQFRLSLPTRLRRNKEIEEQNEAHNLLTILHTQDPVLHPIPGSETASFITIDSSDLEFLSSPTVPDSMRENMPFYIIRKLADMKLTTNKNPKRRDTDESLTDSNEDPASARVAKRCCMSAKMLVRRNFQQRTTFNFPQIMFDTKDHMPLL